MKTIYVKAPPGYQLENPLTWGRKLRYGMSLGFLTVGVAIFTTVVYPLVSYQIMYAPRLQKTKILSPLTESPIQQVRADDSPIFVDEVVNTALDYTDSANWFTGYGNPGNKIPQNSISTLSIPRLTIDRAVVQSDHTDLKQSLIHYPGTAMPGDLGNMVIFGHSVLPQFFNPQNYLTIFSTLHTLAIGETIEITSEGASYTYKILEMYETAPNDLSPLAQTYGGRYLTLITCTPPGTYLRRLIIRAQII
ncbi:MAG: Sortase SrtC3 [Microgenomates group bacterium GW2011_GWA2_46_7]|nr:MAG: Sortase SrtC3 [Microgenomates group bacterium GW2011_GWC2_46_7]KKU46882.1 MAG: Sortase SrtC3 [Microgenomates group bacterium GW2011_GWA2_46_7]